MAPLWTAALPGGGGGELLSLPSGGCVVSLPDSLAAFTADGQRVWQVPAQRLQSSEAGSIVTPDGALVRLEEGAVVTRELRTGDVAGTFTLPNGTMLSLTPWGDLAYWDITPSIATLYCVTRTGEPRWSVPFDQSSRLVSDPLALIGADGSTRWSWHAHAPITHSPAVAPDGVVYVGCAGRLWGIPGGDQP